MFVEKRGEFYDDGFCLILGQDLIQAAIILHEMVALSMTYLYGMRLEKPSK